MSSVLRLVSRALGLGLLDLGSIRLTVGQVWPLGQTFTGNLCLRIIHWSFLHKFLLGYRRSA